jgi:hypothetical protein
MHWEVLIVPLIALGVWILGTLFRNEEDERARQRRRGSLEGGGVRVPPRRPVTDLDRFLEEARRRREAAERGRSSSPAAATEAPPPRPMRPPLQQDRPAREAPRRPRSSSPAGPPRRPAAEVPVARAVPSSPPPAEADVVRVVRAESVPVPVAPIPVAEPVPPARALPAPAMPQPGRGQVRNPILTQVVALLRSPQAAGTALVLREIFDQPLCRRPRR